MDTFTCPGCNAPLKLALVPADEPFRQKFTPPAEGPAEPAPAATSEPETKAASPLANRPDVVAAKQGVVNTNNRCAEHLQAMIEETGGWYDPLPSPDIFDKFQAWAVAKWGHPFTEYTKHRLSKVLVENLGATWHKTGKGRMYRLPDNLRPASRPASEDYAVVPVGPAPTSGPAPLTVVPTDNVVQLHRGPASDYVERQPVPDLTTLAAPAQDQEGRCGAWLVANGVPALQCELPEHGGSEDDGVAHRAGGYWWDADSHGRLEADGPAPFVDFPETTEGGEVSVTTEGVFDSAGERLPGDDEPGTGVHAVVKGWFAEGGESVPDADSLPAGPELEKGPDGVFRLPADNLAAAAEPVVAAAPLVGIVPALQAIGGLVAQLEEPLRNVEVQADGSVTAEGVLPAAVAENLAPAPGVPVDVTEVLPAGARLCSCPLTEEQIGWPLRRIAEIFDRFAGGQGLVRLGSLADIDLRRIMSQRYATAMVAPAGSVPPAESLVAPAAVAAAGAAQAQPLTEGPARVGAWYEDGRHYRVPLAAENVDAPFGVLESVFGAGLPDGYELARGGSVEVRELGDGAWVTGPVGLAGGEPLPEVADPSSPAPAAAVVSGEDLQGLVVPDAAAAALAAYRAASAGLAVPDHVADEGDWG